MKKIGFSLDGENMDKNQFVHFYFNLGKKSLKYHRKLLQSSDH